MKIARVTRAMRWQFCCIAVMILVISSVSAVPAERNSEIPDFTDIGSAENDQAFKNLGMERQVLWTMPDSASSAKSEDLASYPMISVAIRQMEHQGFRVQGSSTSRVRITMPKEAYDTQVKNTETQAAGLDPGLMKAYPGFDVFSRMAPAPETDPVGQPRLEGENIVTEMEISLVSFTDPSTGEAKDLMVMQPVDENGNAVGTGISLPRNMLTFSDTGSEAMGTDSTAGLSSDEENNARQCRNAQQVQGLQIALCVCLFVIYVLFAIACVVGFIVGVIMIVCGIIMAVDPGEEMFGPGTALIIAGVALCTASVILLGGSTTGLAGFGYGMGLAMVNTVSDIDQYCNAHTNTTPNSSAPQQARWIGDESRATKLMNAQNTIQKVLLIGDTPLSLYGKSEVWESDPPVVNDYLCINHMTVGSIRSAIPPRGQDLEPDGAVSQAVPGDNGLIVTLPAKQQVSSGSTVNNEATYVVSRYGDTGREEWVYQEDVAALPFEPLDDPYPNPFVPAMFPDQPLGVVPVSVRPDSAGGVVSLEQTLPTLNNLRFYHSMITSHAIVLKLDAGTGALLWRQDLGNTTVGTAVAAGPEKVFVIVRPQDGSGKTGFTLYTLSAATGEKLDEHPYEYPANMKAVALTQLVILKDNTLLTGGIAVMSATKGHALHEIIAVLDTANPEKQPVYSTGGGEWDSGITAMAPTQDGGAVAAAFSSSKPTELTDRPRPLDDRLLVSGPKIHMVKYDSAGNREWQQVYQSGNTAIPYSISQTSDGGYVIGGVVNGQGIDACGHHGMADGWVLRLSGTGDFAWQKTIGGESRDTILGVAEGQQEGSYVLAGNTLSKTYDMSSFHSDHEGYVATLRYDAGKARDDPYITHVTPDQLNREFWKDYCSLDINWYLKLACIFQ